MMGRTVKSYKDIGRAKYVMLPLPIPGEKAEDEDEIITYMVRGMTPRETYLHNAIAGSVEPPMPPIKQRTAMPQGTGKLDISDIQQEDYEDLRDPTFLEQMKTFQREQTIVIQRAVMYALMVGVQGFDLTDDEIREELSQEPHPREPMDNMILRLDQLSEIIMSVIANGHVLALRQKVNELSGVGAELVNFT
jgi:hypothetical protein